MQQPSEIIREGRNLLFERGWNKGDFENWYTGSLCAVGATVEADKEQYVAFEVMFPGWVKPQRHVTPSANGATALCLLEDALPQGSKWDGEQWHSVARWNDAPSRTFDEVVDLFDRAEKLALIAEEEA